jgi:hypothetical protein
MSLYLSEDFCDCEDSCNCVADITFKVNGRSGFGSAVWSMDLKTQEEGYAGTFLGQSIEASNYSSLEKKAQARLERLTSILCGGE